jgi:glycosyltransferase involved in cell wall biosynthesis
LLGIPAIAEVNGIQADEFSSAGMSRWGLLVHRLRERATVRSADRLICVTEGIQKRLVQYYGVEPERCRVVPNATDVEHFRPLPKPVCQKRVGLVGKDFNIGFVGSFQPWVDFDTLLDATGVLQSFDVPVRVTLVGDGITERDIRHGIEKRGISSAVRLMGRVPHSEVPTWIGSFDVCVEPSGQAYVQEIGKSSMKLFEYMACARPVVATALPSVQQTIEEAQCGLLYCPGDYGGLADHLRHLFENPEEKDRMGMRGRAYAVQNHSWARVAQRIEAVMEETVR